MLYKSTVSIISKASREVAWTVSCVSSIVSLLDVTFCECEITDFSTFSNIYKADTASDALIISYREVAIIKHECVFMINA